MALGFADQHHRHRQQEEHIDRDKDDEHPVPFDADPIVLHRDAQIGPEQYPPVGVTGGNQGQIFLQRQKTDQTEKQQCGDPVEGQCQRTQRYDQPPTADALAQFAIGRGCESPDHGGRYDQQRPYPT